MSTRIFHIIGQHLVDFARKKAKGIYVMYLLIYLHGQLQNLSRILKYHLH